MEIGYDFLVAIILILFSITFVVFFLTSLITKEQFEFIDYVTVTTMIFSFNILIYFILGVLFSFFNYSPDSDMLLVGIVYFILYFGLTFLVSLSALKNTLSFAKTRIILALVYSAIYASIFTFYGGIL